MPRFLTFITADESQRDPGPPQELFDAMGAYMQQQLANGELLDTGGLLPSSAGARVHLQGGQMTTVDGPFAEAREVVGGWAFIQARDLDHAIQQARDFLQIHIDHWPEFEGTCEVRQVEDGPLPDEATA